MREEKLEIEVSTEGFIRSAYSDELAIIALDMNAKFVDVRRASHVEWETVGRQQGWTVQSAWDPELYIRTFNGEVFVAKSGDVVVFGSREAALEAEREFFWDLLPPRKRLDDRAIRGSL